VNNTDNKKIIPNRVKQARISRGLSMLELSELLNISKQAVSQYEMGKIEPSKAILSEMSNVLKYPVSRFYKPMPTNDLSSSAVFFRKKKTSKTKDISAAKEKIDIFSEITDYLSQYINFPELNMPKIDYNSEGIDPIDNEQIEEYALTLREHWRLGSGPIDNLMNVVQKNGIMVSKMILRLSKLDAFSVWSKVPYVFLSSDKDANVRIRFDIAHELGHMLMHADYYSEEDLDTKSALVEKIEDEANRFAGAFLLPKSTFQEDIFSTSIDHFIQLKQKWKASISCMIYRCETLGLLSSNQIKYLKDQMTKRVYWRKEPLDDQMPVEKPFAHKQAISLLLKNNIKTPASLIDDIGCSAEEIEQYCFLDKGTLTIKEDSGNVIQLKPRTV
jgi:Predicted Zn peptidase